MNINHTLSLKNNAATHKKKVLTQSRRGRKKKS